VHAVLKPRKARIRVSPGVVYMPGVFFRHAGCTAEENMHPNATRFFRGESFCHIHFLNINSLHAAGLYHHAFNRNLAACKRNPFRGHEGLVFLLAEQ
jgi:hypothetical protein